MDSKEKIPFGVWFMWFVAASFITYMFLLQTSVSVMIPNLMRDFDIDTLGMGLLSSSFFYPYIVFQVPAGILIDWYKPKRVMTIAILLCAVGTLIFTISDNVWIAAFGRAITGFGAGASVAGALYVGLRRFPPSRFAMIAGASEMLGMFGGAAGQVVLAPSIQAIGWRHTLQACIVVGLLLALTTWLTLKDRAPNETVIPAKKSLRDSFAFVMGIPQMWLIGLSAALVFAPLSAFGGLWAVPYLQKLYNTDLMHAATASSTMFLGAGLGAPFIGYLSDRIGKRCLPMILSTLIALGLSLIIIYYPPSSIVMMSFLIFLMGISCCAYVIPFALAKDIIRPEVQGTAMGFTNMMCIAMGAPVLQPLIGWLLKFEDPDVVSTKEILFSIHDYHYAFSIIPLVFILGLVCVFFIKETHCESTH